MGNRRESADAAGQKTGTGDVEKSRQRRAERERQSQTLDTLAQAISIRTSSFSGPLPPPEILAVYDHAVPGSGDRIIRMAEEQGAHRRDMERQELTANVRSQTRGQYLAFVLAIIVSAGGIFLLATGRGVEGLVALLTPLAGLAGVFLISRSRERKEARSSDALRELIRGRDQAEKQASE